MNEMRFPAAFLQGIYYNSQRPQYLNFGGIGSLVGHEMTHGFDRQGRNFDHKGRCMKEIFYPFVKNKSPKPVKPHFVSFYV